MADIIKIILATVTLLALILVCFKYGYESRGEAIKLHCERYKSFFVEGASFTCAREKTPMGLIDPINPGDIQ